jgi:hypothetical protein
MSRDFLLLVFFHESASGGKIVAGINDGTGINWYQFR